MEQQISETGDSSKPLSVYANIDTDKPFESSTFGGQINVGQITAELSLGFDDTSLSLSGTFNNTTYGFSAKIDISAAKFGLEGWSSIQGGNSIHKNYVNVSASGWFVMAILLYAQTGQIVQAPHPG